MLDVKCFLTQLMIFSYITSVKSSITGLNYMDPNRRPPSNQYRHGEDPCNPLYWYPRNIPEYCYHRNFLIPEKPASPITIPIPVPIPQPNIIMPIPSLPAVLPGFAPLPYGAPIVPSNPMLPISPPAAIYQQFSYPYETNAQQAGMLPGLPGLVTKDGGINILPFSDAYSDILENHKNQMLRRRLKKLIHEYEDFPNYRNYRRLRKYAR